MKNTFPCVRVGAFVYGVVTSCEVHGSGAAADFETEPSALMVRSAGLAFCMRSAVQ